MSAETKTTKDKILFCMNGTKQLTREDCITIAKILIERGYSDDIKEGADGCRFNMIKMEADVNTLNEIYNFISNKIISMRNFK
jgi:hypothetical protein